MSFLLKFVQTNALLSIPSTAALQNATRSFATRISAKKIADIRQKLGFPLKPMRPLNPFFRFSNDLRRTLKDVGNRKGTDVVVELAALWRGADNAKKAIYQLEYEKDMNKYKNEMEAYKSKITDDQAAQLKNDLQLFKTSEKRKRGKEARKAVEKELGKPKRPLSGYFLFAKDLREKSSEKVSAANVTAKWKALGDAERTVYIDKAAISHVNYRKVLQQWEEKMVKTGNLNVVSANHAPSEPKNKAASTKSKPKSKTEKSE